MLSFLVTSAARRRLLALLFGERAQGTAGELAEQAGVSFASAYRELREMGRYQLVREERDGNRTVYQANDDHPEADLLRRLVTERRSVEADDDSAMLRRRLRTLGAPLAVEPADEPGPLEATLAEGVKLARRDPVLARALPVAFWAQRERLDPTLLTEAAKKLGEKHAVAFFLDLTGVLGDDPRFARWARKLRDRRVQGVQDFFRLPTTEASRTLAPRRTPKAARRWGFEVNEELASFQSLFDKSTARGG